MKKLIFFSIALILLLTSCDKPKKTRETTGIKTPVALPVPKALPKPVINVYIENSGSMNGYVNGKTEFREAVYNYLSDIKISEITDSLNLHYINSKVIPLGSNMADFIKKLTPKSFKEKGGVLSESDIANVLELMLKENNEGKISLLVTDGIFSPGKDENAQQYLNIQQIRIKGIFADYLKKNKTSAVMVYQLFSKFDGIYYNNVDAKISINENRPFYIWVVGDVKQLCRLREKITDDKLKERSGEQICNIFTTMNGSQPITYYVNPSIGKFTKSQTDNKTIKDLKIDSHTGKATFAVNVDFSGLLLDENYILNPDNYENRSKYALEVKKSPTKGCTHTLTFTSDHPYAGIINVKLKANMPAWVAESNDDIGITAVKNQTFGIKYQLGGVYEAFTYANKYYTEIKIKIKIK